MTEHTLIPDLAAEGPVPPRGFPSQTIARAVGVGLVPSAPALTRCPLITVLCLPPRPATPAGA